jgi:hypothetical protein
LALQPSNDEVIVPASEIIELEPVEERPWPRRRRLLPIWVRLILLVLAGIWLTVFVIGALLNPYYEDGTARRMETHRQLGLPECTFKEITGYPCPSCGMTTSFSLLMHGDVWNSLKANFAGTILATLGLLYVPWSILSAWRGRFLYVHSLELTLFRISIVFIILLFGRWAMALAVTYWSQPG